jgi:hypothetical protein
LSGIVARCSLTYELVGGMCQTFEVLITAARLDSDVEFDQPEVVVREEVKPVAVGQCVLLWNKGCYGWRLKHRKLKIENSQRRLFFSDNSDNSDNSDYSDYQFKSLP